VLYKNFAKTIGFPHKTPARPAQIPHFKARPGYKLPKTWLPAVPVGKTHKKKNSSFQYFYVKYMKHNNDAI